MKATIIFSGFLAIPTADSFISCNPLLVHFYFDVNVCACACVYN